MSRRLLGRMVLVAVLATAVAAYFLLDLGQYLTLSSLKARQVEIASALADRPLTVIGCFFLVYVAVTALSIPGAAILTLAAGAIFGLWQGTLLVSFASSLGATLAFLASRYVARDWVKTHFGKRVAAIDRGVEKGGAFYLVTLRLIPAFPFFIVNLAMGLTAMRVVPFYLASQIGMLPGTIIYILAGTRIAAIRSISDILSPGLIVVLMLLALFPLLAKWGVAIIARRRVYRGFRRPRRFDRNVIVIGAGAGGLVASFIAATVRAKVTLVESDKMGGDCLNYGCVPSKALIRSARLAHEMRHADDYGLKPSGTPVDFRAVMRRVQAVIATIAPADSVERYRGLGVDVRLGHARIVDPWTVEITATDGTSQRLTSRSIVIAAGAQPVVPEIVGLESSAYLTSDTMWDALAQVDHPPGRLVIIGGGPVGTELAQAFARLGSTVALIEAGPRILSNEDTDVSTFVADMLAGEGVDVRTGKEAVRVEGKRLFVRAKGGEEESVEFDVLIMALGRKARLTGYGLEELAVETDRTIVLDDHLRTVYPNIFAVGDVAGPYQFTHFAAHQAWYAVVNALFGQVKTFRVDYSVLPWVTFTDPEVAHVGLNEAKAQADGVKYDVVRYDLDHLDRAVAEGAARGFIKLLVEPGKDRLLGATIVSAGAGELLAELVLAMKHGLGLNKILGTIHAYPTMAEANKYAAGEWKKANQPMALLKWAERYHRWRRR